MSRTIATMFLDIAGRGAERPALLYKSGGRYVPLTWQQYRHQAVSLANWLISLDLKAGDHIALLSETRHEWVIADMASHLATLVNVPIYPTLSEQQIAYILRDSGARLVIASTPAQLAKVQSVMADCPALEHLVLMTGEPPIGNDKSVTLMADAVSLGAARESDLAAERQARINAVATDDLCSIIYTSGTTGDPKGVMLSHRNFLSNAETVVPIAGLTAEDTSISFLPLSHVLERVVYYGMTSAGGTIGFAESIDSVAANLQELRPTVMATVPRLLEKVYRRVLDGVQAGSPLKQKLFNWAVQVGHKHRVQKQPQGVSYLLADKLVFSKLRERLGGRMRLVVCGGAPMNKDIGEFFYAAGLSVCEGYGLTETSPVISFNEPSRIRYGTVGQVIPKVQVKIAADGEICVKGPNVMMGYYNNAEATAETFDADGWFKTGDIGDLDGEGYLRITDRKKEIIVLSNGKNIAPQPIENQLKLSAYIEQAMVVGDNRQYCTALLVPSFDALTAWAQENGVSESGAALCEHPKVNALIAGEVERALAGFAQYERIKRFTLLPTEWSVESGELTPTMKCKRRIILQNCAAQVDAMYASEAATV